MGTAVSCARAMAWSPLSHSGGSQPQGGVQSPVRTPLWFPHPSFAACSHPQILSWVPAEGLALCILQLIVLPCAYWLPPVLYHISSPWCNSGLEQCSPCPPFLLSIAWLCFVPWGGPEEGWSQHRLLLICSFSPPMEEANHYIVGSDHKMS